jgi:hypothetical protein
MGSLLAKDYPEQPSSPGHGDGDDHEGKRSIAVAQGLWEDCLMKTIRDAGLIQTNF